MSETQTPVTAAMIRLATLWTRLFVDAAGAELVNLKTILVGQPRVASGDTPLLLTIGGSDPCALIALSPQLSDSDEDTDDPLLTEALAAIRWTGHLRALDSRLSVHLLDGAAPRALLREGIRVATWAETSNGTVRIWWSLEALNLLGWRFSQGERIDLVLPLPSELTGSGLYIPEATTALPIQWKTAHAQGAGRLNLSVEKLVLTIGEAESLSDELSNIGDQSEPTLQLAGPLSLRIRGTVVEQRTGRIELSADPTGVLVDEARIVGHATWIASDDQVGLRVHIDER